MHTAKYVVASVLWSVLVTHASLGSSQPTVATQDDSNNSQSSQSKTKSTSRDDVEMCSDDIDSPKIEDEKEITPGVLINKVAPKYPKDARKKHIQGTVVLCAVIRKDGSIRSLRAVSGPPELFASAVEAVRRWRYRPYRYRGQPVEVGTDIRVNFELQ